MQTLYPKLREADILVLATPVYVPLPSEMQKLLNRLVPLLDPVLKREDGRTRAKFRSNVKIKNIALVASSGWYEIGNLGTVLRIAEEFAKDCNVPLASALLRPHVNYLTKNKDKAEEIFEAARKAGYQLVKEGTVSKDLLATISQPMVSEEDWWR